MADPFSRILRIVQPNRYEWFVDKPIPRNERDAYAEKIYNEHLLLEAQKKNEQVSVFSEILPPELLLHIKMFL